MCLRRQQRQGCPNLQQRPVLSCEGGNRTAGFCESCGRSSRVPGPLLQIWTPATGPAWSVSRRAPHPVPSEPVPSPSPRGRPARDQGHRAGCRRSVPDRGLTSPTRTAFSSRRLGYGLSRLEEKYVLGGKRSPRFSRPRPGRLLHIAQDVPPRGCPHGRSPTARGAPRLIDWHPALAQQVTTTAPLRDRAAPTPPGKIAQASAASSPRETRNPSSSTATPETAVTRTVASSSTRSRAVWRSRRRERETTSA